MIKPREGYASWEEARDFCRDNDILFFGEGISLADAREVFLIEHQKQVSERKLSDSRQEVCQWWGVRLAPVLSTRKYLSEKQWAAIRKWAERNPEILEFAPSLKFCARVMQSDKVPCNPEVLQNSLSFMKLWNEAKEQARIKLEGESK